VGAARDSFFYILSIFFHESAYRLSDRFPQLNCLFLYTKIDSCISVYTLAKIPNQLKTALLIDFTFFLGLGIKLVFTLPTNQNITYEELK